MEKHGFNDRGGDRNRDRDKERGAPFALSQDMWIESSEAAAAEAAAVVHPSPMDSRQAPLTAFGRQWCCDNSAQSAAALIYPWLGIERGKQERHHRTKRWRRSLWLVSECGIIAPLQRKERARDDKSVRPCWVGGSESLPGHMSD